MSRKHLSKFLIVLVAALLGFVMTEGYAMAKKESKTEKILEKVSKESNTAMRKVRWARVALFDGEPDSAKKFIEDAKKDLAAAEKKAPELVVTVKSQSKIGGKTISSEKTTETSDFVPIDAWLVLSEDFVSTPEKDAKIKKANEHLKKGDRAKALEVLRAANIGVSVSRMLMPLKTTMKHVDKALALVKDHKYYEANLALKGAEDGLIVDSVLLYEPVGKAKGDKAKKK